MIGAVLGIARLFPLLGVISKMRTPGPIGAALIAAAVVALVTGPLLWWQGRQVNSLEERLQQSQTELQRASYQLNAVRDNRDELARSLDRQSERVQALQSAAQAAQQQADGAAREVLQSAETFREADAAVLPDPEGMNTWMRGLFSSQ